MLIEGLAWAAGSVDAWSYFGVGHVFTANMTGNTVLLGLAIAGASYGRIVRLALAVVCYALGVLAAGFISGESMSKSLWPQRVSRVLACETTLLIVTCWLWIKSGAAPSLPTERLMIGLAAGALGIQSGAMRRLGIPGIVTTYVTGTLTTLMDNVVRLFISKPPVKAPKAKKRWEERMMMQGGVLVLYCLGAAAAGGALRFAPDIAPIIPTASVFLVTVYGAIRHNEAAQSAAS